MCCNNVNVNTDNICIQSPIPIELKLLFSYRVYIQYISEYYSSFQRYIKHKTNKTSLVVR